MSPKLMMFVRICTTLLLFASIALFAYALKAKDIYNMLGAILAFNLCTFTILFDIGTDILRYVRFLLAMFVEEDGCQCQNHKEK